MKPTRVREVSSTDQSLPTLLLAAKTLAQTANLGDGSFDSGESDQHGIHDNFAQIINIQLNKDSSHGLGFSIVDSETLSGVFVASVIEDSPAKRAGLRVNDEVQLINEENVQEVDRITAAVILKSLPNGPVALQVRRSQDVAVVRTLQQLLVGLSYSRNFTDEDWNSSTEELGEERDNLSRKDGSKKTVRTISADFSARSLSAKKVAISSEPSGKDSYEASASAIGIKSSGSLSISTEQQQQRTKDQERQKSQSLWNNKELFPQTTQTRFHGCLFQGLFIIQMLVGVIVLILECVTAGLFSAHIYGVEYAGIYVGAFAAVAGAIGLWSSVITVPLEKEQTFYWCNLGLQCLALANSIALLGASIAIYLRHQTVRDSGEQMKYDIDTLLRLKVAVFVFHIFLILFAIALVVIITLRRRHNLSDTRIKNKV
ncbi:hypothetical protein BV898_08237 [Hypsibius exemplaris]|uniref:PDZ domain-containing protein n=1 Tax=Hypsibius exemplaris TaxID=2072580 RepID=A0A1W0WR04_HYPEX|nr:hypothetical protein BV898_08237 [Hypsibius exemplaris]